MTSQRSYTDYLEDILTAATNAMQFIAGVDLDAFRQDVEKG